MREGSRVQSRGADVLKGGLQKNQQPVIDELCILPSLTLTHPQPESNVNKRKSKHDGLSSSLYDPCDPK